MNIVAIVQARMGSTRLPGKILADIAGKPMLTRVVERVRRASTVSQMIVATSVSRDDDRTAAHCTRLGVEVFRGDEHDVLRRFADASLRYRADLVVRVTADCPLIDPPIVDRVVSGLRDANPRCAFAANTLKRTFPRGLDVEAIRADDLIRLERVASEPYHRAHVFPYVYEHPDEFPSVNVADAVDRSWMRWTVDTEADLEFVRTVWGAMASEAFVSTDVLRVLDEHPEWLAINDHVVQKAAELG